MEAQQPRPPPPPPKIGSTMFFVIQFLIKMLKNKAQIARETIKITLELPGLFSGPWTPAESEFDSARVMCVLAHNLLHPLNENPGSAPGSCPNNDFSLHIEVLQKQNSNVFEKVMRWWGMLL